MKVLVVNSGSSSIKYQVFGMPEGDVLCKGLLERIGEGASHLVHSVKDKKSETTAPVANHEDGMKLILATLTDKENGVVKDIHEIQAVGHRVVHGGEAFTGSVLINDAVIKTITDYCDLAPLHNPPNLTGIKATMAVLGSIPQVACFDTAFHQTIPEHAYLYAIPHKLYEEHKIRRYGFHGTSHRYVTERAQEMLGKKDINIITCHLGNGCSMTAVKDGKSVDTTMGLTPLEGLVMGTRSGDIDPAIIFHLADSLKMPLKDINTMLNKKSGLIGISGLSNDMRNLDEEAKKGNKKAALAISIFAYRVRKYIGAYMAVLNHLDGIVFTGGIGENNAQLRVEMCGNLDFWGIAIDTAKNTAPSRTERIVSTDASRVKIMVIPTDEEKAIAHDTYDLCMD
ncbi:MAG: acetate kinase [Spirochaetes bacterium]|nr:acetate kinase [Spirochaetota bacterium]